MKKTLLTIVAILFTLNITASAQSALDGFDPNANGTIWAVVVQPDGKILIGGEFTTLSINGGGAVTRNRIARLNPDGTLDTAFNPNANGIVYAIAVQADGKVLAGGAFTTIGGQPRNRIARLDATTGAADSFNPNANGVVFTIAVQADGKILAGGNLTNIGGASRGYLARLDPTTGLADSWNPNTINVVYGNLDNDKFVDTLINHTGVSFTAVERDALVSGLANGTLTRSAALRSIAENNRFVSAKFNEAFVIMEYFGYLRRDSDDSGFQFWVNKLNQFGGNFEQADMVKAFIISGEYRDRFPR